MAHPNRTRTRPRAAARHAETAGSAERTRQGERTRAQTERSDAIIGAAMEEFAENGYAGARLDDVAARAGVSKGLVYVYFETKEALFKAAVRRILLPRFESLIADIEASPLSTAEILRGPLLGFMQSLPKSRLKVLMRLMIAEGPKHPDLTAFYHDEVISRGMGFLRRLLERGIARGEVRPNALQDFPHLVIAPMLVAVVWSMLFERHAHLDTDRMLAAHIDNIVALVSLDPVRCGDGEVRS